MQATDACAFRFWQSRPFICTIQHAFRKCQRRVTVQKHDQPSVDRPPAALTHPLPSKKVTADCTSALSRLAVCFDDCNSLPHPSVRGGVAMSERSSRGFFFGLGVRKGELAYDFCGTVCKRMLLRGVPSATFLTLGARFLSFLPNSLAKSSTSCSRPRSARRWLFSRCLCLRWRRIDGRSGVAVGEC